MRFQDKMTFSNEKSLKRRSESTSTVHAATRSKKSRNTGESKQNSTGKRTKRKRQNAIPVHAFGGGGRAFEKESFEMCRMTLDPEDFKILLHSRNLEKMKKEEDFFHYLRSLGQKKIQ